MMSENEAIAELEGAYDWLIEKANKAHLSEEAAKRRGDKAGAKGCKAKRKRLCSAAACVEMVMEWIKVGIPIDE